MTVTQVGGTSTTANAAITSGSAASPTDLGSDAFLKLMVAQLKYQDPLNPAQGTEFLAQTAQFTMVEKLSQLAEQNAESLATQRVLQAGSLVGRAVTYTDDSGVSQQGIVTSARLLAAGPVLQIGGTDVPLSALTEIAQASPVATSLEAPTTAGVTGTGTASTTTSTTDTNR